MKIAALADIHGNLAALRGVLDHLDRWGPDQVVVLGDTVNRGPRPLECLQIVCKRVATAGWPVIRGNHEDYVLELARSTSRVPEAAHDVHRHTRWTVGCLGGQLHHLQVPYHLSVPLPPGGSLVLAHGSLVGTRDGIYPHTSDAELAAKIDGSSALFLVGHTHRPLVRRLGATLVVNVGSVGLPFDGDWRGCYAQLEWRGGWQARLVRFAYDRTAAERDFSEAGFLEAGGPLTRLILEELTTSSPRLFAWTRRYQRRVAEGELTMQQSVDRFRFG